MTYFFSTKNVSSHLQGPSHLHVFFRVTFWFGSAKSRLLSWNFTAILAFSVECFKPPIQILWKFPNWAFSNHLHIRQTQSSGLFCSLQTDYHSTNLVEVSAKFYFFEMFCGRKNIPGLTSFLLVAMVIETRLFSDSNRFFQNASDQENDAHGMNFYENYCFRAKTAIISVIL